MCSLESKIILHLKLKSNHLNVTDELMNLLRDTALILCDCCASADCFQRRVDGDRNVQGHETKTDIGYFFSPPFQKETPTDMTDSVQGLNGRD